MPDFTLKKINELWHGHFKAMASPCEVLIDCNDAKEAKKIIAVVSQEVARIERKWSRYRSDSIVEQINNANGENISVDQETADMLDYAETVWKLSAGRFDITSGVLRRAWNFNGSSNIPKIKDISEILPLVGWQKATWQRPRLSLAAGMEIDFGGIGKEYAADRALAKARVISEAPLLVNLGGDLACDRPRRDGQAWQVGIESRDGQTSEYIALKNGGVATSGDSYRFLTGPDGKRYSHVLDATTGWSVPDAPCSITVAADTCTMAGMMSTLAMLKGKEARPFLEAQGLQFKILAS